MEKIDIDSFRSLLGSRIVELRTQRGITQEELAFTSNVPIRRLSDIENGKTNFQIDALIKICNALMTNPKDMVDVIEFTVSDKDKATALQITSAILSMSKEERLIFSKMLKTFFESVK